MCFPAALATISAVSSVAGTIAGYQGQRQMAKQQRQQQRAMSSAESERFQREQSALRMEQGMKQEEAGRDVDRIRREGMEQVSTARTAAGEAGVTGGSVDALISQYIQRQGDYTSAMGRQQEMRNVASGLSLEEMGLGHRQRLIDINRPVQQPSLLTAGAGLARAGVGITRQYRQDVGSDLFK